MIWLELWTSSHDSGLKATDCQSMPYTTSTRIKLEQQIYFFLPNPGTIV